MVSTCPRTCISSFWSFTTRWFDLTPVELIRTIWGLRSGRTFCDDTAPEDIELSWKPDKTSDDIIFEVREVDRDSSFIRRFLTESLMRKTDLFEHQANNEERVVSHVSDEENWQQVKQTLLRIVGIASIPIVKILNADYGRSRVLYLRHEHDGRDLDFAYAEKTLGYVYQLWGRKVHLETIGEGNPQLLSFDDGGLSQTDDFQPLPE